MAVDLDGERPVFVAGFRQLQSPAPTLDERSCVDQIGRRQPEPAATANGQAEGESREPREGSQEESRGNNHLAQAERFAHD